jgi:hypothetical protein
LSVRYGRTAQTQILVYGLFCRTSLHRCHRAKLARRFISERLGSHARRTSGQDYERRFPPPWSVEEQSACYVVRDHNGQALSYGWRSAASGGGHVITPGSQSKLMITVWASKDANFGIATGHWYDSH